MASTLNSAFNHSSSVTTGTPLSRIRKKLFLDNLMLPFIAVLFAGSGVFILQKIIGNAYLTLAEISEAESGGMSIVLGTEEALHLMNDYFLPQLLWKVPVIVPLLVILAVMCTVTMILTASTMRMFGGSIAQAVNTERIRK